MRFKKKIFHTQKEITQFHQEMKLYKELEVVKMKVISTKGGKKIIFNERLTSRNLNAALYSGNFHK